MICINNQKNIKLIIHSLLVLCVILLVLIIPQLNISGYINSTITSKFICFLYGCLFILGLFVINTLLRKAISISFSKLDIVLFILLIYITLNRYIFQTTYGFSIRYIELLGLSFLYVVLRAFSFRNYYWIFLAIIMSGIIQAIYGNLQLLGYYPSNHSGFRLTGSFFNPGPYAGFLSAVWPIALGMYVFKNKIIDQVQQQTQLPFLKNVLKYIFEYVPLLGIISILLVIPASQSRAAWLAVLISSLVLFELKHAFFKRVIKDWTYLKKGLATGLLIAIFSISFLGIYHFKKGSSDGRLFIWKVTTEIIKENPVFGVGFDRFKAHYMNAQADYFAKNGETLESMVADNSYYAFNEWLQFFSENGVMGLLCLFSLVLFLIITKVKEEQKEITKILKTGILAIGVFACFSYPMQILPIKVILIVVLALLASLNVNVYKIEGFQNIKMHKVLKTALLVITVIGITKGSLHINKLNEGFNTWKYALTPYLDYESSLKEYKKAYPLLKKDGDFLMNYGKTLCLAKKYPEAITVLNEAKQYLNTTIIETALGDAYKGIKQYNKSETAYKHAYNMIPSRFYPMYLLAKLYDDSGNNAKAVAMANSLLNKKVKIASTAIKEMKIEMKAIIAKHNINSLDLNKSQYK